jgi:hypothetical protein
VENRAVTKEEGEALAAKLKCKFMETSAKTKVYAAIRFAIE